MGADDRVMERLRRSVTGGTRAERAVARLLLAGPPGAGLMSSARLAESAGVSGPTVSRFVSRLGYGGYAEFQDALRADLAERERAPDEVYRDQLGASAGDLQGTAASVLEATRASLLALDPAELGTAVELLSSPRNPVVCAGGSISHLSASYLAVGLRTLRPRVTDCPPTAVDRSVAVADLGPRSVVVVFDFRQYESSVTEFARAAKAARARVALVTDPWMSPVAEVADAVLTAAVEAATPFEVLSPTFAVIEVLVAAIARETGQRGTDRVAALSRLTDAWLSRPRSGA